MDEIFILIAKVIMLIAEGISAIEAVTRVANECNIGASMLWSKLPNRFKR